MFKTERILQRIDSLQFLRLLLNCSRIADILVNWLWIYLLRNHDLRLIKVCLVWLITIPMRSHYLRQFYYARQIFAELFIAVTSLN